jgi:hypothetical protein
MWKRKKSHTILVGNTKEKRKRRPRSILEGNSDTDFRTQDKKVGTGIKWLRIGLLNTLLSTK